MPRYDYRCGSCGTETEVVQSFTDPALTECPSCGAEGLKKVYGSVGVVFKGSGFYRNDSREESKKSKAAKKDSALSGSKDSAAKTDKPADKSSSDSAATSGKSDTSSNSSSSTSTSSKPAPKAASK